MPMYLLLREIDFITVDVMTIISWPLSYRGEKKTFRRELRSHFNAFDVFDEKLRRSLCAYCICMHVRVFGRKVEKGGEESVRRFTHVPNMNCNYRRVFVC